MKNLLKALLIMVVAGLVIAGCKQKDEIAPRIYVFGKNPFYHTLNQEYIDPVDWSKISLEYYCQIVGIDLSGEFDTTMLILSLGLDTSVYNSSNFDVSTIESHFANIDLSSYRIPNSQLEAHGLFPYSAEDNKDGDITSSVLTDMGTFDKDKRGEYIVTYSVSDAEGNSTTAERKVYVKNTIEPYCVVFRVEKYIGSTLDTTYNTTPKPSNTDNHWLKFSNFSALTLGIDAKIEPEDVDASSLTITKKIVILNQDVYRDADNYWYRVAGRKTTEGIHLSELFISGSDVTMTIKYSVSKSTAPNIVDVDDVDWAPAYNVDEVYVKQ